MRKLSFVLGTAVAALMTGAAAADVYSVDADIADFGADDPDGQGSGVGSLYFDHDFALPEIVSIDSVSFDLSHSFLSDLHLLLIAPNGDEFVLAQGNGGFGHPQQSQFDGSDLGDGGSDLDGLATYTFVESGGGVWNDGDGTPPQLAGDYDAVSWHAGGYDAGTWTVQVWDVWDTVDDGALGTVSVAYTPIPGPGALALLGLAGLVRRRRR